MMKSAGYSLREEVPCRFVMQYRIDTSCLQYVKRSLPFILAHLTGLYDRLAGCRGCLSSLQNIIMSETVSIKGASASKFSRHCLRGSDLAIPISSFPGASFWQNIHDRCLFRVRAISWRPRPSDPGVASTGFPAVSAVKFYFITSGSSNGTRESSSSH